MAAISETQRQREHLFEIISREKSLVFCGDERPSDVDLYIHVFGGAAFIPYNLEVVSLVSGKPPTEKLFEDVVADSVEEQHRAGLKVGIHSDDHTEHGDHIVGDQNGEDIGCGYLAKRAGISALIAERAEEILAEAKEKRPELFTSPGAEEFARKVIEAHAGIAEKAGFFTNGRAVGLKAMERGAPGMVVRGDHVAKKGFLNLRRDSTFNNNQAAKEDLLSYNHDQWAVNDTFDELNAPYNPVEFDIACTIDAFGTMKALGVEEIVVRR